MLVEKENYNSNLIYHLRLQSNQYFIQISMWIDTLVDAYSGQTVSEELDIIHRTLRAKASQQCLCDATMSSLVKNYKLKCSNGHLQRNLISHSAKEKQNNKNFIAEGKNSENIYR